MIWAPDQKMLIWVFLEGSAKQLVLSCSLENLLRKQWKKEWWRQIFGWTEVGQHAQTDTHIKLVLPTVAELLPHPDFAVLS